MFDGEAWVMDVCREKERAARCRVRDDLDECPLDVDKVAYDQGEQKAYELVLRLLTCSKKKVK